MSKKIIFTIATLLLTLPNLSAQSNQDSVKKAQEAEVKKIASDGAALKNVSDTGWKSGGFFSTNLSNTSFSNWAAGGTNSSAVVASLSAFAIYHTKNMKSVWENYIELALGVVRNGAPKINDPTSPFYGKTNPFVKNEDKLIASTKFGRKIHDKVYFSSLVTLNTQMLAGWAPLDVYRMDNHISNFMAPGFGYLSLGLDYKPVSYLSVYVSPMTAKYTVVREQRLADLGLYGVKAAVYDYSDTIGGKAPVKTANGQTVRMEFGWYVNVFFKKDIAKNVMLMSRLELFNNYSNIGQNIDVNWQNTLNMKVNEYLSVSVINQLIYDYDVDTNSTREGTQIKVQFKNFVGIGFSYKFGQNCKLCAKYYI